MDGDRDPQNVSLSLLNSVIPFANKVFWTELGKNVFQNGYGNALNVSRLKPDFFSDFIRVT